LFIEYRGEYFLVGRWGGGATSSIVTANYIGINGRRKLGTLILEEMATSGRYVLGPVTYYCLLFAPDQTLLETITGKATTIGRVYAEIDDVFSRFITPLRRVPRQIPPAILKSFQLSQGSSS
tara:strand:- start:267 stop:632 length:366 start_codon:yes stop_codon:yes gene_type:complete